MRNSCKHKKPIALAKAEDKTYLWCGACGAIRADSYKKTAAGLVLAPKVGKWMSPQLALGKPIDN